MNTLIYRKIEDKIVDYYAMAILLPKDDFYKMLIDAKYFESTLEEKRRIIKDIAAKKQIH